jgi:hypothetical protein
MNPTTPTTSATASAATTGRHLRRSATLTSIVVAAHIASADRWGGRRGQRGEGIVSVAIAVLIMAALGVVAYGAFDTLFNNTTTAAESQISSIGG